MILKEGFKYSFDESKCESCGGKCCTGESGNIFVNQEEIKLLREHFRLGELEFRERFLRKVGFKFSLKEKEFEDGFACIFFDTKKRNCSIYALRPTQCKTFPFWDYFKTHKKELEKECIGITYLS
ncbi:YkgJ family cysteine cluster protein [Campylobacter vulpis]|uniref:YkgJ family cysteine cluster protein n=1 Tax=Campylobacter vulpis TaxID=1655500 RepID=A0ABS5P191_9BACT|nr:YkgJ family cysteine cluster protein [Campylobacter vulpis]MBS4235454.1 YkgJ family cysteine cluster protein [Campylobacter vulpis]MBS4240451.1 YkgJ family cysteine cluster protein [Campylobacter vulpis]MBS4251785.1 YkgJ family cysteine cluster protein [Campylobacter vulpis]MBS4268960.1 YkgJ family cysteine cluster protein [Campylobacter vulpis]MBS4281438.1 YkgJ family cysteine cluster protein [Campylobacter vulpis]